MRYKLVAFAWFGAVSLPTLAHAQHARWEIDGGIALRGNSNASIRAPAGPIDPNLPPGDREVELHPAEHMGSALVAVGTVTFRFTPTWSIGVGGATGSLGENSTLMMTGADDSVEGSIDLLHAGLGYRLQVAEIAPLRLQVGPALARRRADAAQIPPEPWSPAVHGKIEFLFPSGVKNLYVGAGVEDYAVFWDSETLQGRTTRPGGVSTYEYDGAAHVPAATLRIGVTF